MYGRSVLIAASVLALAGCEVNLNSEGIVARETKTFPVTGTPEVEVATFDGAIEIHSWDRKEVEVEIERRAMEQSAVDEMKVVAEQVGNKIVVKVTSPPRRNTDAIQIGVHFGPSARLRVAVPKQAHINANSGDGAITIEDVTGKILLTTNDGSVRASRLGGEIQMRSGDGSIRVDRVEGKLDLETDDGTIAGDAKPTVLRAHTGDGSIRIQVEPDAKMTEDWDVRTEDGAVVLTLPGDFSGEVDAETRDGSVRATHPSVKNETRDGEDREQRRRTLKATFGSGGKTVRIRTGDGSIRIEG